MRIRYIDKPAGSGKTRFIRAEIAQMVHWDHKVLLVQPSKALINQTYDDLIDAYGLGFPATKIHNDTTGGMNVASEIVKHFNEAGQGGQVLLITHAAFDMVPHFHRADTWDLIFDECPKVEEAFDLNVPEEHGYLTDHVELYGNGIYAPCMVANRAELRKIIEKDGEDDVRKVFRNAAKRLMSKGWTSYVKRDHYNNILKGEREDEDTVDLCRSQHARHG